jgi:hypothetical protein
MSVTRILRRLLSHPNRHHELRDLSHRGVKCSAAATSITSSLFNSLNVCAAFSRREKIPATHRAAQHP